MKRSEPDFDIRAREHLAEKQAIGKRAAELFIEEGDVVGIDSGSTTLEIVRNLPNIPLTIVTHSLAAANVVAQNRRYSLIMLGGVLQHEANCLCGPQAIAALHTLYINKLFLSTSGLLPPDGLSCNNLPDAEVKQALISSSRQIILCMDSSKIGRAYLARFATLNAIDTLITDNGISDESREVIEQQQIQIITVSTEIPASLPELTALCAFWTGRSVSSDRTQWRGAIYCARLGSRCMDTGRNELGIACGAFIITTCIC